MSLWLNATHTSSDGRKLPKLPIYVAAYLRLFSISSQNMQAAIWRQALLQGTILGAFCDRTDHTKAKIAVSAISDSLAEHWTGLAILIMGMVVQHKARIRKKAGQAQWKKQHLSCFLPHSRFLLCYHARNKPLATSQFVSSRDFIPPHTGTSFHLILRLDSRKCITTPLLDWSSLHFTDTPWRSWSEIFWLGIHSDYKNALDWSCVSGKSS